MSMANGGPKGTLLLERIGGSQSLKRAVDEFYALLMKDEDLQPWFEDTDIRKIKWHVFNFMSMVMTWIPPELDMKQYIGSRHAELFDAGLTAEHFDIFAGRFVESLMNLNIPQVEVDEASQVLLSLRPIFEEGSAAARARKQAEEAAKNRKNRLIHVLVPTVAAAIAVAVIMSVRKRKA